MWFDERHRRTVYLLHGVCCDVVAFYPEIEQDTQLREIVFLRDGSGVFVADVNVVRDFLSGDVSHPSAFTDEVHEVGESITHGRVVEVGPTNPFLLLKELRHDLGDFLVRLIELGREVIRHHVRQGRFHGTESVKVEEDFSPSFPKFTDGEWGGVSFLHELFSIRTIDEETSLSPLVSLFPEIDGKSDDDSVSFLS